MLVFRGAPASFAEEEELSFETSKGVKVINTFEGMGIRDALLRGVYAFGFEKPSAIQQRAIMPISQGIVLPCCRGRRQLHVMRVVFACVLPQGAEQEARRRGRGGGGGALTT